MDTVLYTHAPTRTYLQMYVSYMLKLALASIAPTSVDTSGPGREGALDHTWHRPTTDFIPSYTDDDSVWGVIH